MKILNNIPNSYPWRDSLTSGKRVRVSWSQTRCGYAVFVGGRMEGPLFDTEQEAVAWVNREAGKIILK